MAAGYRAIVRPHGWHLVFSDGVRREPPVGQGGGGDNGWTRHVLRNVRRWVQSQEPAPVDVGVTLTLGPRILESDEWKFLLSWFRRHVLTDLGFLRWMYVVELQERGQPHLHLWLTPKPGQDVHDLVAEVMRRWIRHTDARGLGQWMSEIHGAVAFERYLVKHVSKSVGVSQRNGLIGYGRVWSHSREGWAVPADVERAFRVVVMSPELAEAVALGRTTGWGPMPGESVLGVDRERAFAIPARAKDEAEPCPPLLGATGETPEQIRARYARLVACLTDLETSIA
jgi:hypothetical protein